MTGYRIVFAGAGLAGVLLLSGCSHESTSQVKPAIQVSAGRDYGYVTGDLIPQTLTVHLQKGQQLDTLALPEPGAVNDWLSIRKVRLIRGNGMPQEPVSIEILYQVFKGVREPEQLVIPPLVLKLKGDSPSELTTPEWKFNLVPVIPPDNTDESLEIQEPLSALPMTTNDARQKLLLWLTGLLTVIGLFGIRHAVRSRRERPFAEAAKGIRQTLAGRKEAESLHTAVRLLHRAFDRTFGETLFSSQIERFCREHPDFNVLRQDIEKFYVLSETLFFAPESARVKYPFPVEQLIVLAKRCAVAERSAL